MERFHYRQCSRDAVTTEDGKAWCRQHTPSVERARRAESAAKRNEKWAALNAEARIKAAARDLLVACKAALACDLPEPVRAQVQAAVDAAEVRS